MTHNTTHTTQTVETPSNNMKPGHEERRKDVIVSLLNDGNYEQALQGLKYLIVDLEEEI